MNNIIDRLAFNDSKPVPSRLTFRRICASRVMERNPVLSVDTRNDTNATQMPGILSICQRGCEEAALSPRPGCWSRRRRAAISFCLLVTAQRNTRTVHETHKLNLNCKLVSLISLVLFLSFWCSNLADFRTFSSVNGFGWSQSRSWVR